jgi:uncharacterized protein YlzI (FlbEa/FlbD family)
MRRLREAALVFILLTQLDGSPIWVESTAITIIRPPTKECHHAHGSALATQGGRALCVKESPEQIQTKVRENR